MAGHMTLRASGLAADAPFSYECHRCMRCCYGKLIQVNPYEVARLARNRGLSTGAFLREYVEPDRPYLRRRDDGACVFLGPEGCTVHPDRPLVCRVYPLGRHEVSGGMESEARYSVVHGHPQSEGIFGTTGTIANYLRGQGIEAFTAAATAYLNVLQALFDAWRAKPAPTEESADVVAAAETRGVDEPTVLDLDRAIAEHCRRHNCAEPADLEARIALHLEILRSWI